MTFQSPKNSQGAYVAPTRAWLPLDKSTRQLGMNSCGIVSR